MPPKAKLKRSTTIQQTVEASQSFVGSIGTTRKRKAPVTVEIDAPKKKVKLVKQQTMKVTAKEGKTITKGKARGKTRGKTAAKKPKV